MRITDVRTAVAEANYDRTFTRIYTDEVAREYAKEGEPFFEEER